MAEERVERERRERELREERERKCREELDKLKAMEKERHHRAAQEAKAAQAASTKENHKLQQLISTHNANLNKPTTLNTTQTLPNNTSVNSSHNVSQSYDLTPVKKKVFKPSPNPENYDIDDKGSDESTDDDQAPKKKIPDWASGTQLKSALIRQFTNPPDLEAIFQTEFIPQPDLEKFFPNVKQNRRFKKRTSSAIWTSPVFKKGAIEEMRFTNR